MLNNILALRPDTPSPKLYPMHSGSLIRVLELPAGTKYLPATLSSTTLVHPRTRMRQLLDGFHKVRISVSLHRISLKHIELPSGRGRKEGRNVLSSTIFTNSQKSIHEMTCDASALKLSPAAHARLPMFGRRQNITWAGFGPLGHAD
jgi:hypothetical protein